MIKAVIFDMDGVLIDAREWHYVALNRALELFGFEISRHQHLTSYDGLPTRKKLELLSLDEKLPVALHGFISELKQKYTIDIIQSECHPTYKHLRLLTKLKLDGYKTALASNSVRQSIELMMTRARLLDKMDFVISAEEVTKPKPNPEIYLKAINELGFGPEECLVVEDNQHGIRAAQDAQAHVLAVQSPDDVSVENVYKRIQLLNSGNANS